MHAVLDLQRADDQLRRAGEVLTGGENRERRFTGDQHFTWMGGHDSLLSNPVTLVIGASR